MLAQIIAGVIFVVMFGLIISEKIERHYVTLISAAATLIFVFGICMQDLEAIVRTLNVTSIFTIGFWYEAGTATENAGGINWATIIFIAGMMVMVEGMARAGFFHWLCMSIAKLVRFKPIPIFITFMIMSAVLAMFIDSITVILFLAAVTVELAQLLKFNPIPMILAEIFCANLGGAATMCGDPPNIIIGTSLGYTFLDFITNTGVIAAIALVLVVIYYYLVFRKQLVSDVKPEDLDISPETTKIKDKKGFVASCIIFGVAIVLLITHAQTGLTVASIGLGVAIVTVIVAGKSANEILKKIDYKTLLFFIGLFVVIGGLEETGLLLMIADFIGTLSGGNLYIMLAIILWLSAVASAFVDNIPFAATMIPIIKSLSLTANIDLSVLAWALAIGTDIGGSATPIGASANVVGMSVAAREGYYIGWGKYCKYMVPATVIVITVSMFCIWFRYL